MWRAENSEATWDSALGSLYVRFGRWEGELRSVGSMRGRYQIHVPISDFFRISSRPRVLAWLICAQVLEESSPECPEWPVAGWDKKAVPRDLFPSPCGENSIGSGKLSQSESFWGTKSGAAAAGDAQRRVFVKAPLMGSVPVAVYSLQMTTFIHQSQLRSTPGISRSSSFQCYLSLLLPALFFFTGLAFLL